MGNHKYARPNIQSARIFAGEIMTHISSSGVVCSSRLVRSCVRPATDVLGAVVTRASLIAQVHVDIRNMNNLNWSFSTGGWTSCIRLSTHGNGVRLYVWPLAEPKDGKAEKLGSPGADCHDSEIVGKNWTFQSDGSGTEKSVEFRSHST